MLTSQGKRREEEGTEWDLPDFRARERRMTSVTTMLSAVGWFWGRWTGLGGAGPEGSGGVGLTGLFFFLLTPSILAHVRWRWKVRSPLVRSRAAFSGFCSRRLVILVMVSRTCDVVGLRVFSLCGLVSSFLD